MRRSLLLLPLALILLGCPSFDRTTFDTLSVSNSVLKTAQADYEAGKLARTDCIYNLITDGKRAQGVAEQAFLSYYVVEHRQQPGDAAALQTVLVTDLSNLAPTITALHMMYDNPTHCGK